MASIMVGALPMIPQTSSLCSSLSSSQSETLGVPFHLSAASLSVSAASSPPSPFGNYLQFPLSLSGRLLIYIIDSIGAVYCGRGDRKTEKGKRFNHSFGNARPRDKKKGRGPPRLSVPPVPPKKDLFDDDGLVKIEIDESRFSG
uniref:30S ribosomal protein S31ic n=1 Tax=Rhizophora mucronata TaxID=61149 RepID=A0A2P2INN5_RHIMU